MTQSQQGDVLLFQTNDGGDIIVEDGIVEMSGGLESAVYLSLFGGNIKDNGLSDSKFTWWGNIGENVNFRSETQYLLQSIPSTLGNLQRITNAVKKDLQWFLDESIASTIDVVTTMVGLNKISIDINMQAIGDEFNFKFVENWKAGS